MVGHDHGWCALLLLCHIRSSVRPAMSTLLWGSGAVYHGPDPATYLASSSIVLPSPGRCYPRKLSVVSSARRLHDYTLALDARLYITAPSTNPALVSNHLARRRVPRPRCVYRCFITKKKKKQEKLPLSLMALGIKTRMSTSTSQPKCLPIEINHLHQIAKRRQRQPKSW